MIALGKLFFKIRNALFPVLVLAIYLAFSPPVRGSLMDVIAIALVALGVFIRFLVIGYVLVLRDGDNKVSDADELFTRGMFGLCRNPLYTGNITTYFGVFLLHGAWPVLAIGVALFLFIYYAIIFSEEAFLSGKFGADWDRYRAAVPRLVPRLGNWKTATEGMAFSLKRGFWVEYNVMTQAIVMVALALWYKAYAASGSAAMPTISVVMLVTGLGFLALMRILKKRARG